MAKLLMGQLVGQVVVGDEIETQLGPTRLPCLLGWDCGKSHAWVWPENPQQLARAAGTWTE